MMNITTRLSIMAFSICSSTACNSFYPPWNSPRDYPVNYASISDNKPSVLTMTDELRSVIIVPGALHGINSDLRICPEPPADAADNIANSFVSTVKASESNPGQSIDGQADISKISSSDLASILDRSQGLELFRDGSNALCLAWINDVYNNGDLNSWRDDFRYLLKLSYMLIDKEVSEKANKKITPPDEAPPEEQ